MRAPRMRLPRSGAAAWLMVLLLAHAAQAGTRYVGSCGTPTTSTIAAAIAAASSGDTILICAGTYNENVSVDRNLTLATASGAADVTINGAAGNALTIASQSSGSPTLYPRVLTLKYLTLKSTGGYGIYGNYVNGSGTSTYTFTNLAVTSAQDAINLSNPGGVTVSGSTLSSSGGAGLVIGANGSGTYSISGSTVSSYGVGLALGGSYSSSLTHTLSSINVTTSSASADAIDITSGALTLSTAVIQTNGVGVSVNSGSTNKNTLSGLSINSGGSGIAIGANNLAAHVFSNIAVTCSASGCTGLSTFGGATFSMLTLNAKGDALYVDRTNGNTQTYTDLTLTSAAALGIDIRNTSTATSGLSFGSASAPVTITSNSGGIYIGDAVNSRGTVSFDNLTINNATGQGIQIGVNSLGSVTMGTAAPVSITNQDTSRYGVYISAANAVTLEQLTINSSGGGVWLDANVSGSVAMAGSVNQALKITASGSGTYGLYLGNAGGNALLDNLTINAANGYGISAGANAAVSSMTNFTVTSSGTGIAIASQPNSLSLQNGSVTVSAAGADAIYLGQSGSCQSNQSFSGLTLSAGAGGRGLSVSCGSNVQVSGVCTSQGARGMFFDTNAGQVSVSNSSMTGYTTTGIEMDSSNGGQVQNSCFNTATVPLAATPSSSGNNNYNNQWNNNYWKGVTGSKYQPGGSFAGVNGSYTNGVYDNQIQSSCPAAASACYTALAPAAVVGSWHFDELNWSGTAADVVDASAGNNGTAHGGAQETAPGRICFAGSFDGSSGYITIPSKSSYYGTGGLSLAVWVSPSALTQAVIFQNGSRGRIGLDSQNGFYAQFSTSNNGGDGGNGYNNTVYAGSAPTLNTWYHIVAVYDGARIYLYINGVLGASQAAPGSLSTYNNYNNSGLQIGANANSGGDGGNNAQNFFAGLIDEPIFFSGALTATQVQTGYANESSGLNWDGSARTCPSGSPTPPVGSFTAFESATSPAGAYTGNINTKIAGTAYTLDVVALTSAKTSVSTAFSGSVAVQVLGTTNAAPSLDSNGCPSTGVQVLASPGTVNISAGRSTISFPAEANAWRYAKVKISYPASSPSVVACSTDAFAIRPASLSVVANDASCAGPGCYLNSAGTSGAPVHAAGQVFTLTASAYNGASNPAITSNYPGSGVALTPAGLAVVTPASVLGTFAPGSFSGSGGTLSSASATYSEAGSFTVQLQDQSFAAVDAAESAAPASGITSPVTGASCSGYYLCSGSTTIGRFVPDHFAIAAAAPVAACGSFTYFGQDFTTHFTLSAQNANNVTTQNYSGSLAKLGLGTWSNFVFSASGNPGGSVLTSGAAVPTGSWSAGSASIGASQNLSVPASPAAPASVTILAKPVDADGVTLTSATAITTVGATLYQGRARMSNAIGPETWDLPVPMRVEYWQSAAAGWQINSADSCTLATVHIASGTLPATATCVRDTGSPGSSGAGCAGVSPIPSHEFLDAAVSGFAGNFNLWLAGTGAGNLGYVNLSATVPAWLQYNWSGSTGNPTATAAFGMNSTGPVLYRNEKY